MNKRRLFIENFLAYGLGGVLSKLIPLVMVPIVARLMPGTEYFGISDLSNTAVAFGSAIAVMGMYDAMYRMFFEKEDEEYRKTVCSNALGFTCLTSLIVFLLMLLFRDAIAQFFFNSKGYANVVYLSATATLLGATNSIVSAPTRMQNRRGVFLVTNTLAPILSYAIAVPLLLAGHYVIALPLAAVLSGAVIEAAFAVMNRRWFSFRRFDRKLLRQMLAIGLPLLPNFLIYWLFNSCDRVMITNMLGIGAAGVYSVGAKLGHVSQLIYLAFAGGWQYFAFSTMKEADQVRSNSRIFEYLGVLSFAAAGFVCAWSFGLFRWLFREEYLAGYLVAPYLFLAPLLQMLFQVIANQFLVIRKTWPSGLILAGGAIVNLICNFFLIPRLGIEGAALATLLGYVVTLIVCSVTLMKMELMVVRGKFLAAVGVMCALFLIWRLALPANTLLGTALALAAAAVYYLLYREDAALLFKTVRDHRARRAD